MEHIPVPPFGVIHRFQHPGGVTLHSGDLLLFLILLLLLKEGDDLEMIIALGLTLLMGLGDDKGS